MASQIKPICGLDRVKLSKKLPLRTPFTLYVFPTTYCNFKCNYCGHSLGLEKMKEEYDFMPQHMNINTYNLIIKQVCEFRDRLKVLSLTGHGEPLLNKELPVMIEIAKNANVSERIEVITNASLLNMEMSRALIDSGLDVIRISLQGITSAKYKDVCGYDLDFKELIDNIKYFYTNKKNCKIFVKVMDVALEDGNDEEFYNLFSDISDRMFIEKCRPVYSGVDYLNITNIDSDRYGRVHKKRFVCPLPFYMLGVFPNGDVEPCDTIYKPIVLGNVNNDTLLDMWNGEKLKEFQIMQLKKERFENSKCAACCAPDDVAHPEDDLDDDANTILKKEFI